MNAQTLSPPMTTVNSASYFKNIALVIGIIGIAVSFLGLCIGLFGHSHDPARYMLSWLLGLSFWLSIAVGMLMLTMIFYIFDAGWPIIIRRQLELGIGAFKWLAILFVPVLVISLFSEKGLWMWLHKDLVVPGGHGTVGEDVLYNKKSPFLNPFSFTIGSALIFGIFIALSEALRRHSFALDHDNNPFHVHFCRKLSAVGIPIHALALTFGAIYWFKSLEYHWFSTMYGVWFFASCIWSTCAVTTLILHFSGKNGPLKGIVKKAHNYYLSCIMLAFTVFWAYISFSQYFLIYNANIPEETFWYNIREVSVVNGEYVRNSWWNISMVLIFGHFFIPFLLLLWYKNKFGIRVFWISIYVLILHIVDLYWNIVPGKLPDHEHATILGYTIRQFHVSIFDITMLIGVGGICIWSFLSDQEKQKAIPVHDPRINESLSAHE